MAFCPRSSFRVPWAFSSATIPRAKRPCSSPSRPCDMSEPDARIVAVPGQPAPPHQAASLEGGEVEIRAESRPSTALVPVRPSRFPRPRRPVRRHLALLAVLIVVAALIGGYLYRQRAGSL